MIPKYEILNLTYKDQGQDSQVLIESVENNLVEIFNELNYAFTITKQSKPFFKNITLDEIKMGMAIVHEKSEDENSCSKVIILFHVGLKHNLWQALWLKLTTSPSNIYNIKEKRLNELKPIIKRIETSLKNNSMFSSAKLQS